MAENNTPKGAEQVILGVSLDTSQASEQGKQLGTDLNNAVKGFGDTSVKSFKQQLKEAKEEALRLSAAGKENTKEYAAAAKQIANLKDQQDILNRSVQAYDPGNKFQAINKVAGLAASSIGGMTGAMTLFGVSSDTANESIAKLQSIQSIVQLTDSWGDSMDFLKPMLQRLGLIKVATLEVAGATTVGTTATKGATIATNGLGLAFKALGIGLIVAALAYLISNWDSLKSSVIGLFPSLDKAGEMFNNVKNIAIGTGNAVVKGLITPFKALYKVMTGDFKGAIEEFKSGYNVIDNFKKGKAASELNDQKNANQVKLENDIKATEKKINLLKAEGKNTEALERANLNKKLQLYSEDKTKFQEVQEEKLLFEAGIRKKNFEDHKKVLADKASKDKAANEKEIADTKAKEDELKNYISGAKKLIADSTKNERQKSIDDLNAKYQIEIDLAKKLGKDTVDLEKAKQIELASINKQYSDEVSNYLKDKDDEKLSAFDKQRKAINDEIEKLKLNATDADKAKLDASKANQLSGVDNIENATNASNSANSNLANVKGNGINEKDTPETITTKIEALRAAELNAEVSAFNLKKLQLQGQKSELEALEADHTSKLVAIDANATKAKIELAEKEKQTKLNNLSAVADAVYNVGALIGQQTVVGKGLSIATAIMDTYMGASKALGQGGIFGFIGAGAVIAAGLKNVKTIMSTKIPAGVKGGGSTGGNFGVSPAALSYSAPVINSTLIKQNESGIGGLRNDINNKQQEPIKAYIVDKDLNKQKQNTDFNQRLSTI